MAIFNELRKKYPVFIFHKYEILEREDSFLIQYFFETEGLKTFTPTWTFPKNLKIFTSKEDPVFQKLVFSLGMVELISYWKCTCSPQVKVFAKALTNHQIDWWKDLYFHGLGEFFYVNGIHTDLDSFMDLKSYGDPFPENTGKRELKGVLLPVGGGKDSAVTMELCKDSFADNYCFGINPRGAVLWSVKAGGYENRMLEVQRTLDKNMLELNREGFLNGHTPFSALVAFSSVLTAYLNGLLYVALSNESSANESTVPGSMVNHQYSKSFRFEKAFVEYEAEVIGSGVHYFSLLRPLSEFQIAWYFSKCTAYHEVFRSCNAGSKTDSWCCHCPKCLFVFLILSPFLSVERLTEMFGENLLVKDTLLTTFEELVGLRDVKPFECVGSRNEVQRAVTLLTDRFLDEGVELPLMVRRFVESGLYDACRTMKNPYMKYYDEENLLPEEFDRKMRHEFLEMVEEETPVQFYQKLFRGKKILLLGYGREGLSTYRFLTEQVGGFALLGVADQNEIKGLADTVATHFGEEYQSVLDQYDYVIKSPGVVLEREIDSYQCEITSQTELFLCYYKDRTIGITGTKGKSTTTALIYHILKEAGKKPVLCGNIGIPPLDCIAQMSEGGVAVFEMSSHQLEYTRVSPQIGILLNVHEEHLDHYGTFEKYKLAKCNVFRNMTETDTLWINVENIKEALNCRGIVNGISYEGETLTHEDEEHLELTAQERKAYAADAKLHIDAVHAKIMVKGHEYRIPVKEIKLLGHHNYFNIGVAYAVLRELGISDEDFDCYLKSFEPLPHRLKYLGEKDGIRYYDDSISTISETAIQAMNSIENVGTILLGGMDRGIDYTPLLSDLSTRKIDHIICMYASGKRIYEEAKEHGVDQKNHFHVVEDLREAVALAKQLTKQGKACVLSPAAASYGYFKNFEERGDVFASLVFEN